MINYNPKTWFSIIFHSYGRHVIRSLRPALIFIILYTGTICYVMLDVLKLHEQDWHSTITMHQLLGIVLGLFLVFRTNTSYDRWWEGRKLWGSMVNNTRNLAVKMNTYLPKEDKEGRLWFAQMISNVPAALKEHLRSNLQASDLDIVDEGMNKRIEQAKHVPNLISSMMYERVNILYKDGKLTGDHLLMIDRELKEFADIVGACERIKNTPIPYSYSMYIKKFIFIYLLTLPFGMVTVEEYMTIPIVLLITYVLLGVELIAEEIEDPFGKDSNDLPTDELAVKIKDNVREILL
jgi:ion channel-forming bestrophin family protein